MDEARLAETAAWGRKLADHGETAELRAAGRAILLLTSDVERLQTELRSAKPDDDDPPTAPRLPLGRRIRERERGTSDVGPKLAVARAAGALSSIRRARRHVPRRAVVALVVVAAAAFLTLSALAAARHVFAPSLDIAGPSEGAELGPSALSKLAFVADAKPSLLERQRWTLDSDDVTPLVRVGGDRLVFVPHRLSEGEHRLTIRQSGGFLGSSATRTFRFVVDRTPPKIELVRRLQTHQWSPLVVAGRAGDATAVTVDGKRVSQNFSLRIGAPVPAAVEIAARDRAGNIARRRFPVTVVPRRPPAPVRAVHVTFYAWADDTLRNGVMRMIDDHRINAVELDLKDESGTVGFDAPIPFARRIGSIQDIVNLRQAVEQLHARGIRVIGRLVCFRDPVHAAAAWKRGDREQVIQTPDGRPYAGYGGFTNFANPAVRRYNIDVAVAAAKVGVDEVLYDYVRRPDGPISTMVFPGLRGSPENAIVGFLRETREALRPYGTFLGASVFGVAADRPEEVAQPIPEMGRQLDYVAPMVYPSHWAPGEYDVSDPNAEPYPIVRRSLRAFQNDVRGTGARVVPWLQDFSLGVDYGPTEVRAQIDAARDDGIGEFLLWDPSVTYTTDALTPDARTQKSAPRREPPPKPPATSGSSSAAIRVHANELGVVPVIMHHEIRPDRVGDYDQTPAEFRHELETLWSQGYWPVRAIDLATGHLNVPAGKTPVVLTFDDATRYQFSYDSRGEIDSSTALGVMLAFGRAHPRFHPTGTFYVLREPFGGTPRGPEMLRWLFQHGYELGNHTRDHTPLGSLSAEQVQRELVLGRKVITDAVPKARVNTMSLPLGVMPSQASLARRGSWGGQSYWNAGVFLVGAEPAPSPFSRSFDPGAIPRVRSSHLPWNGDRDFTAAFWLDELRKHPDQRYVSDGNPRTITFPRAEAGQLAARFQSRARPY